MAYYLAITSLPTFLSSVSLNQHRSHVPIFQSTMSNVCKVLCDKEYCFEPECFEAFGILKNTGHRRHGIVTIGYKSKMIPSFILY